MLCIACDFEVVDVNRCHDIEGLMCVYAGPARDDLETNTQKLLLAPCFPTGSSIRMAIQGQDEREYGITKALNLFRPLVTGKPNPGLDSRERRLGVGPDTVCDFDHSAWSAAISIDYFICS